MDFGNSKESKQFSYGGTDMGIARFSPTNSDIIEVNKKCRKCGKHCGIILVKEIR